MPPPGRGRGRGRGMGGRGRGRGGGPHVPHVPHHAHPHPHPHPHPVPVAAQPKPIPKPQPKDDAVWKRFYHFKQDREVVIKHSLGKYLRVHPGNHDKLDYEGGHGKYARFKCIVHNDSIQLESLISGKMLRVTPNGNDFDVQGAHKGKFTYFELEHLSTGCVHLKTRETFHGGKQAYLAVMHGNMPQKRLKFFVEGAEAEWERPYGFGNKHTVLLQHRGLQNIGTHNNGHVKPDGARGGFAKWHAEPDHQNHTVKLSNVKTGGFLRIHGENGQNIDANGKGGRFTIFKVHLIGEDKNFVKLESVSCPGKFVAVDKDGVRTGAGGKWCVLTLYRE